MVRNHTVKEIGEEPTEVSSTATVTEDNSKDYMYINTELYDGILQKLYYNPKTGKYRKEQAD